LRSLFEKKYKTDQANEPHLVELQQLETTQQQNELEQEHEQYTDSLPIAVRTKLPTSLQQQRVNLQFAGEPLENVDEKEVFESNRINARLVEKQRVVERRLVRAKRNKTMQDQEGNV
jgi:hypothetical protein